MGGNAVIIFPRTENLWPEKGTYRPSLVNDVRSATITCPECGTRGSLAGTHEITKGGHVRPSVLCVGDKGRCGFHRFIRLADWGVEASPEAEAAPRQAGGTP